MYIENRWDRFLFCLFLICKSSRKMWKVNIRNSIEYIRCRKKNLQYSLSNWLFTCILTFAFALSTSHKWDILFSNILPLSIFAIQIPSIDKVILITVKQARRRQLYHVLFFLFPRPHITIHCETFLASAVQQRTSWKWDECWNILGTF